MDLVAVDPTGQTKSFKWEVEIPSRVGESVSCIGWLDLIQLIVKQISFSDPQMHSENVCLVYMCDANKSNNAMIVLFIDRISKKLFLAGIYFISIERPTRPPTH